LTRKLNFTTFHTLSVAKDRCAGQTKFKGYPNIHKNLQKLAMLTQVKSFSIGTEYLQNKSQKIATTVLPKFDTDSTNSTACFAAIHTFFLEIYSKIQMKY